MASELYHYGRKGMKWYQHIFTSNEEKKTIADRARSILNNEAAPKFAAERKAYADIRAFEGAHSTSLNTEYLAELNRLSQEYRKAYEEAAPYSTRLLYVDVYLQKLGGEPYRFLDRKYAAKGKKIVADMSYNEKYYSEFWDEHGKFKN